MTSIRVRSIIDHMLAALALALCLAVTIGIARAQSPVELLTVSHGPTRELRREINADFIADWTEKARQTSQSAICMADLVRRCGR
jgi:ABC-type sulfate transport system substrate-binding protein